MELALLTQDRKIETEQLISYQPRGSIVVGLTESQIRRKWIEIICDLMSPKKCKMFNKFRYSNALIPLWRSSWYDAYIALERKETTEINVWEFIMNSGDVETSVGNEPNGKVNATQAWNWSDYERKIFMLLKMDESTWNSSQDITDIYTLQNYNLNNKEFVISPNRIDWHIDIGMSNKTCKEIEDVNKIVHPYLHRKRHFNILKANKIQEG